MEPNLQRILYRPALEQLVSPVELVRRAVGQARVQPDVFLVVREAPVGDTELKLFGNRWVDVLYQLERDERGDTTGGKFCEGGDVWKLDEKKRKGSETKTKVFKGKIFFVMTIVHMRKGKRGGGTVQVCRKFAMLYDIDFCKHGCLNRLGSIPDETRFV